MLHTLKERQSIFCWKQFPSTHGLFQTSDCTWDHIGTETFFESTDKDRISLLMDILHLIRTRTWTFIVKAPKLQKTMMGSYCWGKGINHRLTLFIGYLLNGNLTVMTGSNNTKPCDMQDLQQVRTFHYLLTGWVNSLGANTTNPKIKNTTNPKIDEEEHP